MSMDWSNSSAIVGGTIGLTIIVRINSHNILECEFGPYSILQNQLVR